ncbi:hypothetical protein H8B13_08970 [Hymenobacter sp. BT188]|uniref:HNH endonuclease domain-containing protein n=1 Tax=Hymenobacter sp. BT188 TaxID=2763504 RepID=UPI0016517A8A|nr:HNH endonuclease domain-containing protein [Hymenobacter sp. BT188]MBC6606947.1 hypothetical protein [Hymenobacter sp. BT188]
MTLPESGRVDVSKLAAVFSDTTNSYKFYWLLAILDCLREREQPRLTKTELSLRMLASAWYPLDYFKLSFGKQDGFQPIARFISTFITVDNSPKAPSLFAQLAIRQGAADLAVLQSKLQVLLNWVPYRFIRPFFAEQTRGLPDQKVNALIKALANESSVALYRFDDDSIYLNEAWFSYLKEHHAILRGFTYWHLLKFLQKNNPNVVGLSEKLEKPSARNFTVANKFWKTYLTDVGSLTCIYSGQQLTKANFSLDHFLPWSFVAHDQLWNLVPTSIEVNSAKSNWLPSLDLYFEAYAQLQYEAFQYHSDKGHTTLLEDYHLLFAQHLLDVRKLSIQVFHEVLGKQVLPHIQIAKNLGFSYPYVFKATS